MNGIQISIEHGFAVLCNCWRIMFQWSELKLEQVNPYAKESLSIAYLLSKKYSVHILDKARGPGGRASNKRFRQNSQKVKE